MKNMVGDFIKTSQTFYELAQRTEAALFNSQESTLDKVYYTAVDTSITNALPVRHDSDRAVYEGKDTYLTIFADAMTSSTNDAFSRQFGTPETRSIPGIVLPKVEYPALQPVVENLEPKPYEILRRPESAPYEKQKEEPAIVSAEEIPAVSFKITKKTSTVWGTAEQILTSVDPEFKDKPAEERNSLISALTNKLTSEHRDIIQDALMPGKLGKEKSFLEKGKEISITKDDLNEIFTELKGSKNTFVKSYFKEKISPSGEFSFGTEESKKPTKPGKPPKTTG
jgi:hypothetical protein